MTRLELSSNLNNLLHEPFGPTFAFAVVVPFFRADLCAGGALLVFVELRVFGKTGADVDGEGGVLDAWSLPADSVDGFGAGELGEVPGCAGVADVVAVERYGGDEGGEEEEGGMS